MWKKLYVQKMPRLDTYVAEALELTKRPRTRFPDPDSNER